MKVNGNFTDSLPCLSHVKDKGDKNDGGNFTGNQFEQQRQKDDNPDVVPVSDSDVNQAIESFESEQAARFTGLKALPEGSGPSLRVILRDGSGAIVRQMTGKEFLQLRTGIEESPDKKGGILDKEI